MVSLTLSPLVHRPSPHLSWPRTFRWRSGSAAVAAASTTALAAAEPVCRSQAAWRPPSLQRRAAEADRLWAEAADEVGGLSKSRLRKIRRRQRQDLQKRQVLQADRDGTLSSKRIGQQPRPKVLDALLSLACVRGDQSVREVLEEVLWLWAKDPRAPMPVLKGLAREGHAWLALQVLDVMRSERIEVNFFHISVVMSACERAGSWFEALRLLRDMSDQQLRPDTPCLNTCINACAQVSELEKALDLFHSMDDMLLQPTTITYGALLNGCRVRADWELAMQILQHMPSTRVVPDVVSYNTGMNVCASAGEWERALRLLADLRADGLVPDKYSFSACITSCQPGGRWQAAVALQNEMKHQQVLADVVSHSAIIGACVAAGRWEFALSMLREMPQIALSPNEISYMSAISACELGGQWEVALSLMRELPTQHIALGSICYNNVIEVCGPHPMGQALFQEAVQSGHLRKKFHGRRNQILDLHGMNPWPAIRATWSWLHMEVPLLLQEQPAVNRLGIIVGLEMSSSEWSHRRVKSAICQFLDGIGLPFRSRNGTMLLEVSDIRRMHQ